MKKSWLEDSIFYEIYPQSFYDSNGDGIGDLRGIESKLDYIKDLACDAIWINPCFESPFEDAGYDVSDFYKVAPRYGTNPDLKRLFKKAEKLGIKILLDLVPGHTSNKHPWFIESCKAKPNKYSNWYVWTNSVWESAEPLRSVSGYAERAGQYITNFFWFQPALNYGFAKPDPAKSWQLPINHPDALALRSEIKKIIRYWLDMGAAGYRVDMASSLVKNDDDKKTATSEFWREVRSMLDKEYPDAVLISEWGEPDLAIKAGFHMDFMLHFGPPAYNSLFRSGEKSFFSPSGQGDISVFLDYYMKIYSQSKGKGYICIPSGNHDMERLAELGAVNTQKLAFLFLLTMPGVPFIYYGDEIGMRHQKQLVSREGGYNRTGARTPMQWDKNKKNFGFSSAKTSSLYLPVDNSPDAPSVAEQQNNPDSLLNFVKNLINLRKTYPVLGSDADFEPIFAEKGKYPFVFKRKDKLKGEAFVAINPSSAMISVSIKKSAKKVSVKELVNLNNVKIQDNNDSLRLVMSPLSGVVFLNI